jgi:uncharacterized Zn-finger protein
VYTIYHVVGVKVGCTNQSVEDRCRQQGLWEGYTVEILEVIPIESGDRFAGDREWYWADHYRYDRGAHYMYNWNNKVSLEERSEIGKRSFEKAITKGTHVTQLGLTGTQTGVAQKASAASSLHHSKSLDNKLKDGKTGRAGAFSQLAKGKHVTQLGKTGFHQTVKCPYCPAQGGGGPMARWHFDNCPHRFDVQLTLDSPIFFCEDTNLDTQEIICPYCGEKDTHHTDSCPWKKMADEWCQIHSTVTPDNPNLYYVD